MPYVFQNDFSLLSSLVNNMLSGRGVCDAIVTVGFIVLVQTHIYIYIYILNHKFVAD